MLQEVDEAPAGKAACYRFGPTRFSVIPKVAVGKISIRFVPDQNAETLMEGVKAHLQHEFAKLRSHNKLTIKVRANAFSCPSVSAMCQVMYKQVAIAFVGQICRRVV